MAINTYQEFLALPHLYHNQLQTGDILLKKIFPETVKHAVEKIITGGQKIMQSPEQVKVSQGLFHRKEKWVFENKGSPTSEHAAIIISPNRMAEAVGEGVIQAFTLNRSHERYIAYRCNDLVLRDAAVFVATGLSTARAGSKGGKYNLGGAAASLFRNPNFQQNTWINRRISTPTEKYLNDIIDYVYGVSNIRPNMFCSEFAVTCYEAGSLAAFGRTAFGSNPRAVSPLELENLLNYRLNLFQLVGHVEAPADPLFEILLGAVEEYDKSLKKLFRRPSPESLQALEVFRNLLDLGPSDYLFFAVEHYLGVVSKVPYDPDCRMSGLTAPLKKDSTFFKIMQKALMPTNLFYM